MMPEADAPRPGHEFDAFLPPEMAQLAEEAGVKKASLPVEKVLALAVLAGAFIALGAVFSTTVTVGATERWPFGVTRLVAGAAFSLGLILVIVAGAELFTGNNLIVMAWAARRVSTLQVLRNWVLVYIGNFAGAVATAALVFAAGQFSFAHGEVGQHSLDIALAKCQLGFVQAMALGALCNALVCLAVWLCTSARSTTDRIVAIVFPITAFVASGFEHSVANMYFVPMGLFIKTFAPGEFWLELNRSAAEFPELTWENFLWNNLVPVTLGNVVGGAVMVGAMYWFIYLRRR
jgi:formate transporter FocA